MDTAHRAALLYSFAALLIAAFVEVSRWSAAVNLIAAGVVLFFFAASIATYVYHGLSATTRRYWRDTADRCRGFGECCQERGGGGRIGWFAVSRRVDVLA